MFINYGRPEDYLQLQELFNTTENIFQGKVLLAKQFHVSASEQVVTIDFNLALSTNLDMILH